MGSFFGLLFIGIVVVIIIYASKESSQQKEEKEEKERLEKIKAEEEKKKEEELLKEMWEEKKNEISNNGLPTVSPDTLHLTKNEICHFIGDASFCKIKKQVVGYEGGSRGVSFRLMKGVSFRVGNHRGHYVKEEVTEKLDGTIYLTSKKIVFSTMEKTFTIKYDNILTLNNYNNMLQIQTEKKNYLFQVVDTLNFMVILEYILNKTENAANNE